MKTACNLIKPADYLGIDLTDRYANRSRAIDVCGLTCVDSNRLSAAFWQWEWSHPKEKVDISKIAEEVRTARSTMVDGPQGLASTGKALRACEKECGAVGKTPDTLPLLGRPYAGFIRSSVELFSAFAQAGFQVSPIGFIAGVSEVYPGDIWHRLIRRVIPKKSTGVGRRARKLILEALGVTNLPDLPTHDQNDACISAVLAAAADDKVNGMTVRGIGLSLAMDASGTMREGPLVVPVVSDELQHLIQNALIELSNTTVSNISPPVSRITTPQISKSDDFVQKAATLRDYFIKCAQEGNAEICTYAWAYRHLFDGSYLKWSQAYAKKVLSVATITPPAELAGFGKVRLDAFIVSSNTRLPGNGHWESAAYIREDWERVLGTATVLR
jgi:hypothetical protein